MCVCVCVLPEHCLFFSLSSRASDTSFGPGSVSAFAVAPGSSFPIPGSVRDRAPPASSGLGPGPFTVPWSILGPLPPGGHLDFIKNPTPELLSISARALGFMPPLDGSNMKKLKVVRMTMITDHKDMYQRLLSKLLPLATDARPPGPVTLQTEYSLRRFQVNDMTMGASQCEICTRTSTTQGVFMEKASDTFPRSYHQRKFVYDSGESYLYLTDNLAVSRPGLTKVVAWTCVSASA